VSSRLRLVVGLVVSSAICAACVHQHDPTVQVRRLQADIVFGIKATTTTVPSPPPGQPVAPGRAFSDTSGTSDGSAATSTLPPIDLHVNLNPPSDCPGAALDAFPELTAGLQVKGPPPVGKYKWQIGGARVLGINIVPVEGTEQRLIRRAKLLPQSPTDFPDSVDYSFQVVEPYDAKGSVLELNYQVRSNNRLQKYYSSPVGQVTVNFSGPEAGLALVSEDVVTTTGGTIPLFHPVQPLLVLPLPVQPGAKFVSVAADPTTGTVITYEATVLRRARVDACGAIVDGWEVNGLERVASPPPPASSTNPDLQTYLNTVIGLAQAAQVDSTYATQYGAMPIAEHTLQASPLGSVTVDDAIGQVHPAPIPPGLA